MSLKYQLIHNVNHIVVINITKLLKQKFKNKIKKHTLPRGGGRESKILIINYLKNIIITLFSIKKLYFSDGPTSESESDEESRCRDWNFQTTKFPKVISIIVEAEPQFQPQLSNQ